MLKSIFLATSLATFTIVQAGHIGACTVNMDGTGGYAHQETKDCCPPNKGSTWNSYEYNRKYHDCRSIWPGNNGLDTGAMVQCCTDKGRGSYGE